MPPVVFQDFELRRKYTRLPCFSSRGTCLHLELRFHSCFMGPGPHSPEGARSVTAGGGEVQEGGERLPRNQVCWSLAGIPGGTQRCGDAVTAPGQRGAGGHLQVLPAQRSWPTVLRSAGGRPPVPPPPHVQQLLVLAGSTSARPHCSQERVCAGPMTSLFSRREMPWWEEGQGMHAGTLGGSASSGLPCRGFTWGRGTPQSHFPSCHQKRRSCCEVGPSETGPGEKNKKGVQLTCFQRDKMEGKKPRLDLPPAVWAAVSQ